MTHKDGSIIFDPVNFAGKKYKLSKPWKCRNCGFFNAPFMVKCGECGKIKGE